MGTNKLTQNQQISPNTSILDISKNIPATDISSNWLQSNNWSITNTRGTGITGIYPQHKYEVIRYSMRYNLDPSGSGGAGYRDASYNLAYVDISWNTPYPTRSEVTKTNNNNGYQDTLIDSNDTGTVGWSAVSGGNSWNYTNYFKSSAYKGWKNSRITANNLIFLNNGLESGVNSDTIKYSSDFAFNLRANDETNYLGRLSIGEEIIRMRSAIYEEGTISHNTNQDLSGVQKGFTHIVGLGFDASAARLLHLIIIYSRTSSLVDAQSGAVVNQERMRQRGRILLWDTTISY